MMAQDLSLERGAATVRVTYKWGGLEVDLYRHRVTIDGARVALRRIEFKLLVTLVSAAGRLFTRDDLLRSVWGLDWSIKYRTVDTHVRRLRARLGPYRDALETTHGFGYRWRDDPEEDLPEVHVRVAE